MYTVSSGVGDYQAGQFGVGLLSFFPFSLSLSLSNSPVNRLKELRKGSSEIKNEYIYHNDRGIDLRMLDVGRVTKRTRRGNAASAAGTSPLRDTGMPLKRAEVAGLMRRRNGQRTPWWLAFYCFLSKDSSLSQLLRKGRVPETVE
jgi:hypothetical protein